MDGEMDYKTAWIMIQKAFPILCDTYSLPFQNNVNEDEFETIVNTIKANNLTEVIQNLLINRIEKHVREIISPEFWAYFNRQEPPSDSEAFRDFYCAVELLYEYYLNFNSLALRIDHMRKVLKFEKHIYHEEKAVDALKLIFRSVLLSQLPLDYKNTVKGFYRVGIRLDKENLVSDDGCSVCHQKNCLCLQYFNETNQKLFNLGLTEPLVGQVLTSLIYDCIEEHVEKTCKDNFDTLFVDTLLKWLYSVVIPSVSEIYFCMSPKVGIILKLTEKLSKFLYETYTKIRISQLFNIIIEYPESLPALEDLRVSLPKTELRTYLTSKLQKAMETRLLHPGVSTPDILTAYVAAIRSMRVLDPSGLLMDTITKPVHQYLRSREDTVRCVVSSLTEEGPNDLADELVRAEGVPADENSPAEEDYENWETWMPNPIDADPQKISTPSRRSNDIISMLVNVYGSKELFVNEYRTLLADRLLSQVSCDTEKEIRYLELLKLRFGDSQLHFCEVMLKDIADSKRIAQHIKQDAEYVETDVPIQAIVVSGQFWPAFKEERVELHPKVEDQLEKYTRAFETLKGNRTLTWKKNLGFVDLEIELADRTVNLSVTLVHATIMMHFSDKRIWSLSELSSVMQIPSTLLRRKLGFWQSHEMIAETSTDVFELIEEREDKGAHRAVEIVVEEESESAMASAQDQREEELQTIWSYINGMLMNLDTMPLERIHQMLKMFAFQGPTIECSLAELRQFLDRKVREHQLIYSGGLYRLPKP